MNYFPYWLKSLAMAALVSFSAPIAFVGSALAVLIAVSLLPGMALLSHLGTQQLMSFLRVFGEGNPRQGLMILGLTSCLVGTLFDAFNYYRYQSLRN